MRALLAVVVAMAVAACASMGRPEGGPRDTEPPVFVSSNPAAGEQYHKDCNHQPDAIRKVLYQYSGGV